MAVAIPRSSIYTMTGSPYGRSPGLHLVIYTRLDSIPGASLLSCHPMPDEEKKRPPAILMPAVFASAYSRWSAKFAIEELAAVALTAPAEMSLSNKVPLSPAIFAERAI